MNIEPLPSTVVLLLHQALFVMPLLLTVLFVIHYRHQQRVLVAALFAFLFQLGTIFIAHHIAFWLGWWRFGSNGLNLIDFPADIWIGGALLWGPVLFLLFRRFHPLVYTLPIIALNGWAMPRMEPVITIGDGWFLGQALVLLCIMLPGQCLAKWTAQDQNLPYRAILLAIGYGCFAFVVLPTAIMEAMGGSWLSLLQWWGNPFLLIGAMLLMACVVMGLSAVQLFVLHGDGTPIPLDHTKRLVHTGLYAYLRNPMQLCTALAWLIMGALLGNIWVAMAAVMEVVFVLGMVHWHQRSDLAVRFPDGWGDYKDHVPEWRPRWKPWVPEPCKLTYDPQNKQHVKLLAFLKRYHAAGLQATPAAGSTLTYRESNEERDYLRLAALAKAVNHTNFLLALCASALLLVSVTGAAALDILRGKANRHA